MTRQTVSTLIYVAHAIATIALVIVMIIAQLPVMALIALIPAAVWGFGRIRGKTNPQIQPAIANITFVLYMLTVMVAAFQPAPSLILMLAVLAALAAWNLESLYTRLIPYKESAATKTLIRSNLRSHLIIAAISIGLHLTITNLTLQLSLRNTAVLAIILIFSIVSAMRYLGESDG